MSEKPIIFSSEMIKAVLDGRKTQTRRVIKPKPVWDLVWWYKGETYLTDEDMQSHLFHNVYGGKGSPYGAVYADGTKDRLWVRETFTYITMAENETYDLRTPNGCPVKMLYKATTDYEIPANWTPSIYMPRWASRLTLELADIRTERLLDASLADLIAEGCPAEHLPENCNGMSHAAYGWFESLWDSINARRGHGWGTNPWVWVIEFEVVP